MSYYIITAALRSIVEDAKAGALDPGDVGLCGLLSERLEQHGQKGDCALTQVEFMEHFVPTWPEYSGDISFPVPCPSEYPENERYDAEWAYLRCGLGLHRWDPGHPYGQSRIRLAEFLLKKAEDELAKESEK